MSTFGCQFWGFQPGYSLWKPRADLAWPLQLLLHVWPCFLHLIENPSNIVEYSRQPQLNKIMFQSQILEILFFFRKGVPALEFCRAGASRASRAHGRRRAALPTQQPSTCSAWHGIDWTRRFCAVACGRAIIHGIGFATLEMLMIDFDVFFHTLKYSEDIWSSANHGRRRWCFSNISDENFVLEVHEWEYPSRNGNEIDQHMVRSGINYDHVWPVWLRSWFLMVSIWCSSSFDKYLAGMMMIPVVSFILSGCR